MAQARRGVFVTGTDTGVGKTFVGEALIPVLTARGVRVVARKPIESGCRSHDGERIPADAVALRAAAGQSADLNEVCRFRLSRPLSPARAARLEGLSVTTSELFEACLHNAGEGFLWVEGAGGLYSPLTADGLNADLAARLALPVLLVAADRLGCINHVLLSLEAIRLRGLEPRAVVLTETEPGDSRTAGMDNRAELRERMDWPVARIAFGGADADSRAALAWLAELVSSGR